MGFSKFETKILVTLHITMRKNRLIAVICLLLTGMMASAQIDSIDITGTPDTTPVSIMQPVSLELQSIDISFDAGVEEATLIITHPGDGVAHLTVNGEDHVVQMINGQGRIQLEAGPEGKLFMVRAGDHWRLIHVSQQNNGGYRYRHIPAWLSILPPLFAIALALIFREVIISLFIGIWAGAFIAGGMRIESLYYMALSFFQVVSKYVVEALTDSGHMSVIVFSLLIGGMVALISKNGGMAGVVTRLARFAKSARSSQFVTWLLGVAIFFDDYANTLIVGNTMRPVTDKFRVSREKLAYLVDSTAAPIAAVAFITTWIGAELGYIDSGLRLLHQFPFEMTPYAVFISSLRYAFYPILTLIFVAMVIYLGRDYGPMHAAEVRARSTGRVSSAITEAEDEPDMEELGPVQGAPLRWYNAAIPVVLVILVTIYGLLQTGMAATYSELLESGIAVPSSSWGQVWQSMPALFGEQSSGTSRMLGKVIGNADSYQALLWASLTGVTAAILLTVAQRIIKLFDTMHHLTTGFKTMMPALIILTLAWALAATTHELHTADYLTSLLRGSINPHFMPAIIFVLAALIAFSTGSSWSTMAILYPIAIPTTWAVCMAENVAPELALEILLNVIATVMAASVLGDHCSPISDTTILSSLASDCNHLDHVKTQMPYALTVAVFSLLSSIVATYWGGGWDISFVCIVVSLGAFYLIIRRIGKPVINYAE